MTQPYTERLSRENPLSRWHQEETRVGLIERWACVPLTDAIEAEAAAGPLNSGHQLRAEQEGWAIPYAPCICHGFPPHQHDEGLDVERLYHAIVDELVVLWGEPSDAISTQVRPIVARSIAERYAALAGTGAER